MSAQEVYNALRILFLHRDPSESIEIRALKAGAPGHVGYYNDLRQAAVDIVKLDATGEFKGIYATLNARLDDPPFSNSQRHVKNAPRAVDDNAIDRYHWLLLDFDTPREDTKNPATSEEMEKSKQGAAKTLTYLRKELNWPKPLIAMSGNGYHVLFPLIDELGEPGIPVDEHTTKLIRSVLHVLAERFYEGIDLKVFNPSRIWRMYGTTARKGVASLDRPHRKARLISTDYEHAPITRAQLQEVAGQEVTQESADDEANVKLAAFITWMGEQFPDAKGPKDYNDGSKKWVFPVCPWDESHNDSSAYVIRWPSGPVAAGCLHTSCEGHKVDDKGISMGWRLLLKKATRRPDTGMKSTHGPSTFEAPGRTDLGNAKRLVNLYGEDMRYVPEWGEWLFWNGRKWEADKTGKITRRAAGAVATIFAHADQEADTDEAKKWRSWAIKSESIGHIRAMTQLAADEQNMSVPVDQFDKDPWLMGLQNGVLNLVTGELTPHNKDRYISKESPVYWDEDAKCPTWDRFILEVMDGDQEMVDFVHRALGYSLTGLTNEQVMFFAHGMGANGKTTMMRVVQYIMGDYASQIDSSILMSSNKEQHPTGLTDLKGLRFAGAAETDRAKRISESLIKQLTGDEMITARRMRQDYMVFAPTHKIWLTTNYRPIIKGNDIGIWRRIVYLPFTVVIPKEKRDRYLLDKLREEAPGILRRLVDGCRDWQENGLQVPEKARAEVEDYKDEMDQLREFFEDYCVVGEQYKVTKTDLFEAYVSWCEERRSRAGNYRYFHRLMQERGYKDSVTKQDGKSVRIWHGVSIADHVVVGIGLGDDWGQNQRRK